MRFARKLIIETWLAGVAAIVVTALLSMPRMRTAEKQLSDRGLGAAPPAGGATPASTSSRSARAAIDEHAAAALRGIVVDGDGFPVSGAEVGPADDTSINARVQFQGSKSETDALGRFQLQLRDEYKQTRIIARKFGYTPSSAAAGAESDCIITLTKTSVVLGELLLFAIDPKDRRELRVRIHAAAEGDAEAERDPRRKPATSLIDDRTPSASGEFEFGELPHGVFRAWAVHSTEVVGVSSPFVVDGREDIVRVAIEQSDSGSILQIEGRVLQPDGSAAPAAEVHVLENGTRRTAVCSADGRFTERLRVGAAAELQAWPSRGAFGPSPLVKVDGHATSGIEMRLTECEPLNISVRSAGGGPLENVLARVCLRDHSEVVGVGRIEGKSPAKIEIIRQPMPFTVEVSARGHSSAILEFAYDQEVRGVCDVVLIPTAVLRVEVLGTGPGDRACVGATVTAHAAERARLGVFPILADPFALQRATTSALGVAELIELPVGREIYIKAEKEDSSAHIGPIRVEAADAAQVVKLQLANPGALAVRVEHAELLKPGLTLVVGDADACMRHISLTSPPLSPIALHSGRWSAEIVKGDYDAGITTGDPPAGPPLFENISIESGKQTELLLDGASIAATSLIMPPPTLPFRPESAVATLSPKYIDSGLPGVVGVALSADGPTRLRAPFPGWFEIKIAMTAHVLGAPHAVVMRKTVHLGIGENTLSVPACDDVYTARIDSVATPASVRIYTARPDGFVVEQSFSTARGAESAACFAFGDGAVIEIQSAGAAMVQRSVLWRDHPNRQVDLGK